MNWSRSGEWTHRGFDLVVEWHESIFRFRVVRPDSMVVVAEGFARSLEEAQEKADKAAEVAAARALALPS